MEKKYVFGVDVGGTTVKMGLFDIIGNVIDKWEIPTRTENDGEAILPDIAEAVIAKMAEKEIDPDTVAGCGIGVPGPVDDAGVVHKCVNLGWDVINVSSILSNLLNMPVKTGNDANVAALGEMWRGGGQGFNSIVMVTLGTGVGGGIILNGKIVTGATGAAGEIGHIHLVDDEEVVCGCGNRGCLEQYASATGIVRLATRKLASTKEDSVLRNEEVTAKTVFDAVKDGDKLALEVAEQYGYYLGRALAGVSCVVNPEAIVVGGGVSKAGPIVLSFPEKYYQEYTFHGSRGVQWKLATLGNDAGIYGSAKMVLD